MLELSKRRRSRLRQAKALETLLSISLDPDWSIRYAAIVGLQALSTTPDFSPQIQAQFEQWAQLDADLAVRARVQMAKILFPLQI
jgi:phycocyanobilin lyase beta subunit